MKIRQSGIAVTLAWLLVGSLLSACTDLSAVREWSSTSLQAAQFNEVVTTYANTPNRLQVYDQNNAEFWKDQARLRADQADALRLQLDLVADYMAALNALAVDSTADYSKDVGTLTDALNRTGQVPTKTVGAAGKLATTLINASANLWQQREIARLIAEGNPPLQSLLTGNLLQVVDRDFRGDIHHEAAFLDSHFKQLLRFGGGSVVAKAALEEWYALRKSQNARSLQAIGTYAEVLAKISEGHQRLYDNRNELDAVDLVRYLYKTTNDLRRNIRDLIEA